jgi:Na+-driven multidrug efflux pump
MILDPLLILGIGPFPRMEAAGAAIATVLAQFVVTSLLVVFLRRNVMHENILKEIQVFSRLDKRYVTPIVKIGGPIALQSMLYCMFSMVLSKFVTVFGDGAMATQRVGGQVEAISWNTADGFASAMNTFAAQNYGANKMDRVRKGYKVSLITMGLWGLFVTAIFMIFPTQISSLFFYEVDVIALCASYFFIIGVGEAFMCVELMAVGALSGLGQTKVCSLISIILTGLRIPLAYVLSGTALGLDGIWWALTITSISKGIALHIAFHKCAGKLEQV